MTRDERLAVVIVGAGDMGARHALHWSEAGARVLAVVDVDGQRAAALAAAYGADVGDDLEAILRRSAVDVVSVCTPTHLHAAYTIAALSAGAHVLCEKPAALRLEDALAMRDAAATSGRALGSGSCAASTPPTNRSWPSATASADRCSRR